METCIEVQNVVKRFRDQVVLKNVSISFEKGQIHGIVGRNGSGKTVLFKCICGLMHPEEGVILVNGKRVGRDVDMPEDIGAIIEAPGFLPNYSGYKNLRFLANIRRKIGKEEILNVLKTVGLDPESRKHVGKYSLGMRQRLGIAQAIMEDPEILILDEPMNGLDNAVCRIYGHCCWSSRHKGRRFCSRATTTRTLRHCATRCTRWTAGFYCNDIRSVAE